MPDRTAPLTLHRRCHRCAPQYCGRLSGLAGLECLKAEVAAERRGLRPVAALGHGDAVRLLGPKSGEGTITFAADDQFSRAT
jgi:hypothetical protein